MAAEMTMEEFQEVMISMAGWRAKLSRRVSRELVVCMVASWDVSVTKGRLLRRTKALHHQRYGFDPLTWLLIGVVVQVLVRVLLEWWYKDQTKHAATLYNLRHRAFDLLPKALQ